MEGYFVRAPAVQGRDKKQLSVCKNDYLEAILSQGNCVGGGFCR